MIVSCEEENTALRAENEALRQQVSHLQQELAAASLLQQEKSSGLAPHPEHGLPPIDAPTSPLSDVFARRRAEEILQRHDTIMEAFGFAAERFLHMASFEENISIVLERLGIAVEVSRVYIFQNSTDREGRMLMSQRYEWAAPPVPPQIDNPELQNLSYSEGGFGRWEEMLSQGGVICGEVSTFPPDERAILEAQDIRSIAVVPIFVGEQWWGFIGFDDCEQCHTWSSPEISILRAAATTIGAAIRHEQVQATLRESEWKFRLFFEQSQDSLVLVNQQGQVIEWNQGAEQLWSLSRDEVIGNYLWDVQFHFVLEERQNPTTYEQLKAMILELLETGTMPVPNRWVGHEIYGIDGVRRMVHSLVFPIQTGQGVWLGAITRDLTELKRVEEELRQSREAAEAAARAKSEFLANMSHEIRTPMNAVIGMTSLLLSTTLSPEQRDYVETIRVSGDSLLTLINDILDFSKIEAGKMNLEKQPFNLRDCVEEALDLVASKAASKKLDLAYVIDEGLPLDLVGDITRMRQIFVNLLDNAIKFTEQGEVVVTIENGECRTENNLSLPPDPFSTLHSQLSIHITVRDTGIGIPEERLDYLFQSFSQVDTSTTRRYGGTGLGLTISKRLAEMMGGTIWVESEYGSGSTFHVTLQAEVAPPQPRPYLEPNQPHLMSRQILVVDDNATNRSILKHQLDHWGMHPHVTDSAAEALDWIHQGIPFDLAILDMHMPDMDGLTLAEEIRNERDAHTLPILLWTSIVSRSDIARSAHAEIAATLIKPIRPSALYDILVGFFEGKPREIIMPTVWGDVDSSMAEHYPLRILLAEDNVINQKVALRMLEKLGYRADSVSNGAEALCAVEQLPYDVVLMDVQMPEMDGVEATRCIRSRLPAHKQPRIVAMTAHALAGTREWLLQAGMDDYISKPVRLEDLISALKGTGISCPQEEGVLFATPSLPLPGSDTPGQTAPGSALYTRRANQDEPVDDSVLDHLLAMMGNVALVHELIALYLRDAPELLSSMGQALSRQDNKIFTRSAHSLKSSSAQIGAKLLSDISKQLEAMGHAGTLDEAVALLARAETEFERVQRVLTEKMGDR
jgi:PAS domain S-box-containing protein